MNREEFQYDIEKIHKSFSFGPAGSGAKTAMCKAYLAPSDAFDPIDLKICKRNWKEVNCPVCIEIKNRTY